jgi:SAM-dependent methyltransferase
VRRAIAFAVGCWIGIAPPPALAVKPYEPRVDQPGKDVVWVPTPDALVQKMLDLANVTPRDFVIDLGSGDGRIVIAAAQRGARALGIEYNADLVEHARRRAAEAGVAGRTRFVQADLFEADLARATVITLFLEQDLNMKLRPKILGLRPGTRVVSNNFTMGDWEADQTASVSKECSQDAWCTGLLWVVPARVAGTHQTPAGELTLEQAFQRLSGTLRTADGRRLPVIGKVRGKDVIFTAGGHTYRGRTSGSRLDIGR